MELEARLRAFAAFARQRSFSAAASELRISQPALTNAGDFLANHVLRAQSLLAQAALGIAQFRERGSGSLSIVATWLTGTFLLSEIIADFRQAHPAIHLSLRLGTTAQA